MPWHIRTLLTISAVAFPLFLYVGIRLSTAVTSIWAVKKFRARRTAYLGVAFCYILPVVLLLPQVLPRRFSPALSGVTLGWVDYVFHYPFWMALIVVLELAVNFLALDLLLLGVRLNRSWRAPFTRFQARAKIVLAAAAVLYVPARALVDTLHVRDSTELVRIADLPAELEGFTIALVGDIQADRYTGERKIGQMRGILDEHSPDVVALSGDLVTGGRDFLRAAEKAVCPPQGRLASVTVMGDHDWWSAPEDISRMQRRCGWQFLENEHRVFVHKGRRILVTGVTHIYRRRMKSTEIDRLLAGAPRADVKILLAHQPAETLVHAAARHEYDLVLAGHTHGGQIVLHPLGIAITPSIFETQYYSGKYQVGSTTVVVTNGVGLTLAPLRYHAPAEVSMITLSGGG